MTEKTINITLPYCKSLCTIRASWNTTRVVPL